MKVAFVDRNGTINVDMALKKYLDIELGKSFIVGDSLSDVELGNRLGIKTFGINVKSEEFDYILLKSIFDIVKFYKKY